jgi:hypothetical protein
MRPIPCNLLFSAPNAIVQKRVHSSWSSERRARSHCRHVDRRATGALRPPLAMAYLEILSRTSFPSGGPSMGVAVETHGEDGGCDDESRFLHRERWPSYTPHSKQGSLSITHFVALLNFRFLNRLCHEIRSAGCRNKAPPPQRRDGEVVEGLCTELLSLNSAPWEHARGVRPKLKNFHRLYAWLTRERRVVFRKCFVFIDLLS